MKHIVLCIAACVLAAALCAQWSTDPYAPSIIAGFDAEQVIPKVAIVPNGNTVDVTLVSAEPYHS